MARIRCGRNIDCYSMHTAFEPRHEKTGFFNMQKQRRRSASRVTAKLISAFVFATRIVQSLFFLNPKFQASSHLLWLYSPVCAEPLVGNPEERFSQNEAHFILRSPGVARTLPLYSKIGCMILIFILQCLVSKMCNSVVIQKRKAPSIKCKQGQAM